MMAVTLEKLPAVGTVARATIGSLLILAHIISLASGLIRSQQVRGVRYSFGPLKVKKSLLFAAFSFILRNAGVICSRQVRGV